MRDALLGGTLGVGGLLAGSKAFQEQEDPGSIFLAGLGGGLGGYAGLLGAKALAGKYAPILRDTLRKQGSRASQALTDYAISDDLRAVMKSGKQISPEELKKLQRLGGRQALNLAGGIDSVLGRPIQTDVGQPGFARALGVGTAVATVPAAALTAGLGGVAAGAIPGAFGVPGFVDPESYGSSNSPGARYKQTTVNYT